MKSTTNSKSTVATFLRKNFPPVGDYRFWLIQLLNLISCLEITSLPSSGNSTQIITVDLQNSWALKSFVFFFLIATISSAVIFGSTATILTILLTSVFLVPKLISWSPLPYDRVIIARVAVICGLSIALGLWVSRERNLRLNVQILNEKMKEIILEKEKYFKLASQAQENERKRISRDLHDDSLQLLATVMHQLDGAINADNVESVRKQVLRAKETITMASDAIRRYCEELRPMLLDSMGLIPSVEWIGQELEKNARIKVSFETVGETRAIPNQDMIHIYRVMQEAFHNIEKHSKATAVKVNWNFDDKDLEITITDNGIGMWNFGPAPARSLGIQGMHERTELVGGKLTIESQPGFGTRVSLHVPFE